MVETTLTCPSCSGRISTFRLETGRGTGICCECTDSYDIELTSVGDRDEVRTIDLTCRRTGKRSFHLQVHQACPLRRRLVPFGWLALALLAAGLVVFTGLAIANVVERGFRPLDLQILTAPAGLYLLALLGRNLSLKEQVSLVDDNIIWTRSTLLKQQRRVPLDDIAAAERPCDGDDSRTIRLLLRDGSPLYIGQGLQLADDPLDWTCKQLRHRIKTNSVISVKTLHAQAQSHEHIWLY